MKEKLRYLGSSAAGEHTVLVTQVRCPYNPFVLFGFAAGYKSMLYHGSIGAKAMPFIQKDTSLYAEPPMQHKIEDFFKSRPGLLVVHVDDLD